MPRHRGPLNRVVAHRLTTGKRGGAYWQLTLSCGHQVRRRVSRSRHHQPDHNANPPIQRARCPDCYRAAWEKARDALPDD